MYTNTFEEFFRITTNMVDENDYLKLSSILDIAQNIAGDHATELKIGFNEFIKKDLIWVLIRNKVEIVKNIHDPKIIKAVTYPLKPRFIEYPREVLLYVNDELICKIHQVWCIYNIKDNNVVSYKMDDYVSTHPSLFDGRVKKLITSKDLTYIKSIAIPYTYCDHNKHMNNTHYLDLYLDNYFVFNKVNIKSFQIEYLKQSFLFDQIDIYAKNEMCMHKMIGKKGDDNIFYLEVYY